MASLLVAASPTPSSAATTTSRDRLPRTLASNERSARRTPSSAALITNRKAEPTAPAPNRPTSQPVPTAVWTRSGSSSAPATPATPDTTTLMTSAVPHSPLRSSESAPGSTLMRNGCKPGRQ